MKYFAMTNEKSASNLHFKATYGRSLVYITRITQKCIKKPTTTRYRFFFFLHFNIKDICHEFKYFYKCLQLRIFRLPLIVDHSFCKDNF